MKDIKIIDKIDDKTIEIEYFNGVRERIPVIKIESRQKALELLEKHTRICLKHDDAFEKIGLYIPKSQYEHLRNYEIENELEFVTGIIGYRIDEICPFNGFSWFS